MKIIFQNDNFLAIDKASGVLTVPSRLGAQDRRSVLGIELQKKFQQQIFPIHRLDFEVSGLVLFALNAKAHSLASGWFETRQVQKTYRAFTQQQDFSHWPEKIPAERTPLCQINSSPLLWKTKILRGKKRSYEHEKGDPAETLAFITNVQKEKNLIEWKLQPLTGRSHQLRFELSRHGFPILGDGLYGSKVQLKQDTIALRAVHLSFEKIGGDRLGLPAQFEISSEIPLEEERN